MDILMSNNRLSFKYTAQNEEVLYSKEVITHISSADIEILISMARCTKRERIRICAHSSPDHPVHDMLIVHFHNTYVRPHKHLNRDETFHVIQGKFKIIIFNDDGTINKFFDMSEYGSGKYFFFRMSNSYYHTVIPLTNTVVFHETTQGPFSSEDTIFPDWAPDGSSEEKNSTYMHLLQNKI